MNLVLILLASTIIYGILVFVNYKIKGSKSIFVKIGTGVFIVALFVGFTLMYGANIFNILGINVKSFSNLRNFFGSRIIGALAIVLIYLFAFLRVLYVTFKFVYNPILKRNETAALLITVVFDIATIPNIINLGVNSVVFVAPLVVSILMIGLALGKLVFSFIKFTQGSCVSEAKLCKI